MQKYYFAVLIVLAMHCGQMFVMGQDAVDEKVIEESDIAETIMGESVFDEKGNGEPCIADDFSSFLIDFHTYHSEESAALSKNIHAEFQHLREQMQREDADTKARIARPESRIERHNTQMSNSVDEIKRQIRMENMETKNGLQGLHQKLPSRLCPRGFNYSVGRINKCYAVLTDRVNWSTAQRKCIELNGDAQLVVINSSREQRIIDEMLADSDCKQRNGRYAILTNQFWIGAKREDISNCSSPIEWASNKGVTDPMEYNNWASNEPNCGFKEESCAAIDKGRQFKWNDLTCSWNACPLCEVTVHT